MRFLNGWNGKRIAFITEREISEECRTPTYDLVARIKLHRMKHAGDILRAEGESCWQMWTEGYGKEDLKGLSYPDQPQLGLLEGREP